MEKNDFITLRIERTLKELLVSEAKMRKKSLSSLLRSFVKQYLRDKYKKASKGVWDGTTQTQKPDNW